MPPKKKSTMPVQRLRRPRRRRAKSRDPVSLEDIRRAEVEYDRQTADELGRAMESCPPDDAPSTEQQQWFQKFQQQFITSIRKQAQARATQIAVGLGADANEIARIVYSQGDLNSYLPALLTIEESRKADVRKARVLRTVGRALGKAQWPFDGASERHPLERKSIEALMEKHSESAAAEHLKAVQAERRAAGLNVGPGARSFQRVKAVRAIGRELWTYLAACLWAHTGRSQRLIEG